MSNYEKIRLQNLEDNRRILAEIGLVNPYKKFPKVHLKKGGLKRKAETQFTREPKRKVVEVDIEGCGSLRGNRRRSARIIGKPALTEEEIEKEKEIEEEDDDYKPVIRIPPNRPNAYGSVPGVEVGTVWLTRLECCRDGIHRPPVSGIHGGPEGAYSIALSGGYEDDIDLGECFTYTGEGGRDLKGTKANPKNLRTAAQSKDQTLTRGNLALSRNVDTGNTVRVIRGYKSESTFAPEEGYRYDGLYTVEKAWFTTGLSGFGVWKFALRRCKDQAPPPWDYRQNEECAVDSQGDKATEGKVLTDNQETEKMTNKDRAGANDDKICSSTKQQKEIVKDELQDLEKLDEKIDENENICTHNKIVKETNEVCGR
ncbi:hypothetical protein ScPMuIL_012996 [Solemya velum]